MNDNTNTTIVRVDIAEHIQQVSNNIWLSIVPRSKNRYYLTRPTSDDVLTLTLWSGSGENRRTTVLKKQIRTNRPNRNGMVSHWGCGPIFIDKSSDIFIDMIDIEMPNKWEFNKISRVSIFDTVLH